ncbi:MAG: hypothetical protein HQK89_03585 [Nitrospirae bacterium]|nr:hypothetical protein [Nitrospirota bacterium]
MSKSQIVFVSSSWDMADWAALTVAYVRDFSARHGLSELEVNDYRDIDPSDVNHAATWQDNVGAPSRMNTALTIVLLGERLGTPLPADFKLKEDIYGRLKRDGHDWVHVAGMSPEPMQPGQAPLTGVLFEYFDAFLSRADGSQPSPLRVMIKGKWDGKEEPDFGNGEFRSEIEAGNETAQRKRGLRKEYEQQLEWMNILWRKLYGLQQRVSLFCPDQSTFLTNLERALEAEFLSNGTIIAGASYYSTLNESATAGKLCSRPQQHHPAQFPYIILHNISYQTLYINKLCLQHVDKPVK